MELDIEHGHTISELIRSLSETAEWCSSRPKPWNALRSFRSPEIAAEFGCSTYKGWVSSVIDERRRILKRNIFSPVPPIQAGKILVYYPDESLNHGIEQIETEGFVTECNVPPWDTWVAYIYTKNENYLVSWVPQEMVDLVSYGIECSPEQCFDWLGTRAPELKLELESRGIVFENYT